MTQSFEAVRERDVRAILVHVFLVVRIVICDEEEAARKEFGKNAEIYRCERCHTLYRPVAADNSTAGQKFNVRPVTLWGDFFGKNPK